MHLNFSLPSFQHSYRVLYAVDDVGTDGGDFAALGDDDHVVAAQEAHKAKDAVARDAPLYDLAVGAAQGFNPRQQVLEMNERFSFILYDLLRKTYANLLGPVDDAVVGDIEPRWLRAVNLQHAEALLGLFIGG